jgi:L-fucose isomerase-like protein
LTKIQQLTLGFVPIARATFDVPLATEITQQARARLLGAGFALVGGEQLVITAQDVELAAQQLAAQPLDVLVIFQSTFADSTMAQSLVDWVDAPPLLWATPEAPTGGRLRLNSLCGINLAAHALTRGGHRYHTLYAQPDDPAALNKVHAIARAGHARRRLRSARIGRVGQNPAGFETCRVNDAGLKQLFGVNVIQIDLPTIFEKVQVAEPHKVDAVLDDLRPRLAGLDAVDQKALRGTIGTFVTLRDLAREDHFDGYAVRCWPEFFTELGCAACGSSSMLNDSLIPASCETDVNGTITQLILQWISGAPVFDTDIVSFDMDADTAVFWHCGKAPLSMADPEVQPRATIHSNRQKPLLMEFPLKPGRVTLARLSEATNDFRLVIGSGEIVRAPISFTGTSGVIRFSHSARKVLDTLLGEGLEHHLALVYGDHVAALHAFAQMVNVPVLEL